MEYMKHTSPWGHVFDTCILKDSYAMGGSLALELYDTEEGEPQPYASITVNIPGYEHEENCAFVDVNNFPESLNLISEYKLGEPTGLMGVSGFCTYPEYRFDMKEIDKYLLNPEPEKAEKPKIKDEAR